MSPEQIRGKHVDARSDVYSLGCVAYELFNGKPPFTANSFQELLNKHLKSKPPDLTIVDNNITPEFAAFVKRLMAKNPDDRPSSMKEVQMEMRSQRIFYTPPEMPEEETPQENSPPAS